VGFRDIKRFPNLIIGASTKWYKMMGAAVAVVRNTPHSNHLGTAAKR